MYTYEKPLSDTDSIYCRERTNSHQSSIFIAQTNGDVACSLFGDGYVSNMDVKILLSRTNLMLNLLSHFLGSVGYFKRSSAEQWELSREWLLDKKMKLDGVFKSEFSTFHAQINKETTRTYLKGITSMVPDGGTVDLDLRQYLFSGDTLRYVRRNDGVIIITIVGCEGVVAQQKNEDATPVNVDRLSVALKLFAEKRKDNGEGGWFKSGRDVNGRIRDYFDSLTITALQAFNDAKIEELFCGKKGADGKVELETMWSGKNGQGWAHIKPTGATDLKEVVDFLVELKTDVGIVAKFLKVGFKRPKGFGPSVITELLMKFHPESCIKHGERSHNALKWLGFIDFAWNNAYSEAEYRQVCGAAAKILGKMVAMNLPRRINADGTEDGASPDYLTVNEFLYFVDTNLEKIKEEVMSKAMKKPTTKKITTGKATISKLLANKEDSLMTMLVAGLLTKPLAILAGVSGTGKSRMVRHLAYKTCLDEDLKPSGESAPGNFKMVQVKPSWHDSADLLGYRSAVNEKHEYVSTDFVKFVLKAHAYPNTPFFVCLDEMNLAPVEHYFAEFLSACESIRKSDVTGEWTSDPIVAATDFDNNVLTLGGEVLFESADAALDAALKKTKARIEKEGLFIPRNLFVVGTVNMDDSTGGFSRKVLDRAMTIVMNEVQFEDLQKEDKDLTLSDDNLFTTTEIAKFIERKDFNKDMMSDDFRDQLENIRQKLAKTPFALAYRFARETCMYKNALKEILDAAEVVKDSEGNPKKDASGAAIDADRACGDIALDHMILMKLLPRLTGTTEQRSDVLKDIKEYLGKLVKDKKVSALTLDEMEERAKGNGGYLSFWP